MRRRDIARKARSAARLIDRSRRSSYPFGACGAIGSVCGADWNASNAIACHLSDQLSLLMKPVNADGKRYPYTDTYWWGHPRINSEQDHNARVMALLLMAEMIEGGDA